jgi:hypothetical protein
MNSIWALCLLLWGPACFPEEPSELVGEELTLVSDVTGDEAAERCGLGYVIWNQYEGDESCVWVCCTFWSCDVRSKVGACGRGSRMVTRKLVAFREVLCLGLSHDGPSCSGLRSVYCVGTSLPTRFP